MSLVYIHCDEYDRNFVMTSWHHLNLFWFLVIRKCGVFLDVFCIIDSVSSSFNGKVHLIRYWFYLIITLLYSLWVIGPVNLYLRNGHFHEWKRLYDFLYIYALLNHILFVPWWPSSRSILWCDVLTFPSIRTSDLFFILKASAFFW